MDIHHDAAVCIGIGICESIAPAFFETRDDGHMTVLRAGLAGATDEERAAVEQAVRSCPTAALSLGPAPGAETEAPPS
jgi:ferredoxin